MSTIAAWLRARAKALVPFVITIATILVNGLFGDGWDVTNLRIAVVGIVVTLLTYLIPNQPAPE